MNVSAEEILEGIRREKERIEKWCIEYNKENEKYFMRKYKELKKRSEELEEIYGRIDVKPPKYGGE